MSFGLCWLLQLWLVCGVGVVLGFFPSNECLLIFILAVFFPYVFFPVICGRTSYGWHFLARSFCLSVDLIFHNFFDPWIKLEQGLPWQTFVTFTWKYSLSSHQCCLLSSAVLSRGLPDSHQPRGRLLTYSTGGTKLPGTLTWRSGQLVENDKGKDNGDRKEQQMESGEVLSGVWSSHTG